MRHAIVALFVLLSTALGAQAVADAFPRPPELEPAIRFWTRIYTAVDTRGGLLHDRGDLSVVYETVHFGDASHAERVRHMRERRSHYENILAKLATGERGNLNAEEREVLALWPDDVSNARLRQAANEVRFQLGQADRFRRGIVRSGAWEPHIRRTLEDMGLPPEIAALPHVESSFNPDAWSRVGAAGLWQFTRATGRRFMRVDHIIDERMDPFAATVAAARLLEHNHSVTGDWALALTAYNHGLAGVRRAARDVGSTDIARIIAEYDGSRWGFASRNFYPAFLAAVDVDFNTHKYFGLIEMADPLVTETIEMPFYAPISALIEAFGVDRDTLYELNRALRPPVWDGLKHVPRGYVLRVPASPERPSAEEMLARVNADARYYAQLPDQYHRVQRGEALSTIARRYGVPMSEIVALNNLRSPNHIRAGQSLRLPVAGQPPISGNSYTVRRGDTLSGIAARVGMSTGALAAANSLDPSRAIHPGQKLRIDGRAIAADETTTDEPATDVVATVTDEPAAGAEVADESAATEPAADEAAAAEPPVQVAVVEADDAAPATDDTAVTTEADGVGSEPDTADAGVAPADEELVAVFDTGEDREAAGDEHQDPPSALPSDARSDSRAAADGNATTEVDLSADPSDYSVGDDDTIEVHAAETLGHYAEWLDVRASDLRQVNAMQFGTPVVIGHRLTLDFSQVDREQFERRRQTYHEQLQARFFDQFRITGTEEHRIEAGDSLWTLSLRSSNVPVWLLRQYNPDLDFDLLRPGMPVVVPAVERHPATDAAIDMDSRDDHEA